MQIKQLNTSVKHLQINKANNMMMIVVAFSAIIITFSLMSTKALLSQSSYQHRVLKERNDGIKKLQDNIKEAKQLKVQYDVFEEQNPNIIGGKGGEDIAKLFSTNSSGTDVQITKSDEAAALGPQDGDNARIVLDALPSQYDFPALISSLEKILNNNHVSPEGITGTDSGQADTGTGSAPSEAGAAAVPISFSVSAKTDYASSLKLIQDFERSIRPFDVQGFSLSGNSGGLNVSIQANTYYQPGMTLQIKQKELQ